jgi:hypothetical protein
MLAFVYKLSPTSRTLLREFDFFTFYGFGCVHSGAWRAVGARAGHATFDSWGRGGGSRACAAGC